MVVRFDNKALKARKNESFIGVDGDQPGVKTGISEADAIVNQVRKKIGEPDQPIENAAAQIIKEEQETARTDPGPELNVEAVKAAQKGPSTGSR